MSSIKSFKNIKPLLDRVLVRRIKAPTKTESGILIPEKSAETPIEGEVLAVGPGILRDTGTREVPSVKPGDRVILPQYHGIKIKINEDEVSIYKDSEIMAKIDPQA